MSAMFKFGKLQSQIMSKESQTLSQTSSVYSIDSSALCERKSLFQSEDGSASSKQLSIASTASIKSRRKSSKLSQDKVMDENSSTGTLSVQKLRKELPYRQPGEQFFSSQFSVNSDECHKKRCVQQDYTNANQDQDYFNKQNDFFDGQFSLGFVGGFNKKPIKINEDKLKQAQDFFNSDDDFLPQNTGALCSGQTTPQSLKKDEFIPAFCFGGGSKLVQFNVSIQEKAKQFLQSACKDDHEKASKRTVSVKTFEPATNSLDTIPAKQKVRKRTEKLKLTRLKPSHEMQEKLRSPKFNSNKHYQHVKLKDLDFSDLRLLQQYKETKQFTHNLSECKVISCFFCEIEWKESTVTKEDIIEVIKKRVRCQIPEQLAKQYYECICFKLYKFQIYYPQIVDRRMNPSNMAFELYKKIQKYPSGVKGLLNRYLQVPLGQPINLLVRRVLFYQKTQSYYFKLSDGWTTVWSIIRKNNPLSKYVHKLKIGTKIQIACWKILRVFQIPIQDQQQTKQNESCIEFFYNGSRIINSNSSLGKPRQPFYRPLAKCIAKGGNIPLAEGIIVRILQQKVRERNFQYQEHYLQFLTFEGTVHYIKFMLPMDGNLIEYFRLYYCYKFGNLQIDQTGTIKFDQKESRFQNIKNPAAISKQIREFLQNRIIKTSQNLQLGKRYDVYCTDGVFKHQSQLIKVEPKRKGTILYQQYELKSVKGELILEKVQFSHSIERLPKLYGEMKLPEIH